MTYTNQADLIGHLNNILSRATAKIEARAERPASPVDNSESRGVWPLVTKTPYQETDSQGRLKAKTKDEDVNHAHDNLAAQFPKQLRLRDAQRLGDRGEVQVLLADLRADCACDLVLEPSRT